MNIIFTTIAVKNLNESLKFYLDVLGFSIKKRFSAEGGINIVFLEDEKNTLLELVEKTNIPLKNEIQKPNVSIGLEVNNLQETLHKLKLNGIEPIHGPIETPTGQKLAFIEDPNGVAIEFVEGFNL